MKRTALLGLGLAAMAAESLLKNETDVVVPSREEESFATYPDYQAASEKRANRDFNRALRIAGLLKEEDPDVDVFFGPRLFRKEQVDLFLRRYEFDPRKDSKLHSSVRTGNYSEATFFPVANALKDGVRVTSVQVPYRHPRVQSESEVDSPEFEAKRVRQRHDIVTGLIHLLRLQGGGRKSRLRSGE